MTSHPHPLILVHKVNMMSISDNCEMGYSIEPELMCLS